MDERERLHQAVIAQARRAGIVLTGLAIPQMTHEQAVAQAVSDDLRAALRALDLDNAAHRHQPVPPVAAE